MSTINFDTRGAWNAQEVLGPAVHAPPAIRDIHVTTLRIEWLDVSEPEKDFYAKNHMVTTLIFREPVSIDGTEDMSSARLSMELDETVTSEDKVASVEILKCCDDYNPAGGLCSRPIPVRRADAPFGSSLHVRP